VMGGVARRSWARNMNSVETAIEYNLTTDNHITLPYFTDEEKIRSLVDKMYISGGK
ncbi:MAG: hypothetical protein GX676_09595, partial [Bacilli bacterium]|nr:hypothetical protein [Bacilli bacterium]